MSEILAEKLLSATDGAELIGLQATTLRKMAWQRKIRSFKVLGALRFRKSDLEKLVPERQAKDAAESKKKGGPDDHPNRHNPSVPT